MGASGAAATATLRYVVDPTVTTQPMVATSRPRVKRCNSGDRVFWLVASIIKKSRSGHLVEPLGISRFFRQHRGSPSWRADFFVGRMPHESRGRVCVPAGRADGWPDLEHPALSQAGASRSTRSFADGFQDGVQQVWLAGVADEFEVAGTVSVIENNRAELVAVEEKQLDFLTGDAIGERIQ